jgi:hypothetical protein
MYTKIRFLLYRIVYFTFSGLTEYVFVLKHVHALGFHCVACRDGVKFRASNLLSVKHARTQRAHITQVVKSIVLTRIGYDIEKNKKKVAPGNCDGLTYV